MALEQTVPAAATSATAATAAPASRAAPYAPAAGAGVRPRTYWSEAITRLRRNRTAMVGLVFIVTLVVLALIAPVIARYDYARGSLVEANGPMSAKHWLGTDQLGRDELTRLMWGARVSLTVAIGAQAIIVLIGVTLGLMSGFFGGWVDYIIMRFVDALYALPSLLVAVVIMSFLRGVLSHADKTNLSSIAQLNTLTGGLLGIFMVLFLTHWLTVCRLVRGQVMSVKERDFVDAARAVGAGRGRLMRVHILPHVLAPVIVAITFGIPGSIGLEASLSFLGIGVNPPMPSWGIMIAESLPAMRSYPSLLLFPGLALSLTLLSFTYVGDAVRDALDPLMKR